MNVQWFRCFLTLHKKKLQTAETVTNSRGDEVGKNYVSICENCGTVIYKFVPNKLEEIDKR